MIVRQNKKFFIGEMSGTQDRLEPGNYLLKFDPKQGFYLVEKENFILPGKLYGDFSIVDRYLKAWENNVEKNMGVLLSGEKGSGKTITAEMLCMKAKMPVIIIDYSYKDTEMIDFLTNPYFSNSIIFIDEYEKVFSKWEDQDFILPLFDGGFSTKLLFLLTVNDISKVSSYFVNRPGRIKYHKFFGILPEDTIKEVINDLLVNKNHTASVHQVLDRLPAPSFDILVNIIKDMNLFQEDAVQVARHFNLKDEERTYSVVYYDEEGKEYKCADARLSPTEEYLYIYTDKPYNEEDDTEVRFWFQDCDIKREGRRITIFDRKTKEKAILQQKDKYHYLAF